MDEAHRAANREAVRQYKARYPERIKKWREDHPDKVKEYQQRYRDSHPDRIRAARLKRRFGITPDDYARLLAEQGGHCAVCDRITNDDGTALAVDHDHATGEIRGLLCKAHNVVLGLVDDDPTQLERLIAYLNSRTDHAV